MFSKDPNEEGTLLQGPTTGEMAQFERVQCSYENLSRRFVLEQRNFGRQYAHIYAVRLWAMKARLVEAAKRKWGNDVCIKKLSEMDSGETCVVIGTLFKHMELKPSILKDISEEEGAMPQPARAKYTEDADNLILEDEVQRVSLEGKLDVQTSVTGTIVAVYGAEDESGRFQVKDFCYADLPVQNSVQSPEEDRFVVLVSGLGIGSSQDNLLELQLLVDLITGQLGDLGDQKSAANIVRVIMAGNSLNESTQDKDSLTKAKYLSRKTAAGSVEAMKVLDDFLAQLSSCVDVDLMPGDFDPANHVLPQQPLHRCMFPRAMKYPTMHTVPNPYEADVGGIRFLGTSGQNVDDIYKYSSLENSLEILEKTLTVGHIAPTAPDTLGSYPFHDSDPFILESCPHVYFAGNQGKFQSKILKGADGQRALLVTVPKFCQTQSCVLVNLRTLQCEVLQVQAAWDQGDQPMQE
ncbi:DNA polymerase delta subunit 2 [Branchiostoma belcheri]|nr:DNA polymerase delta subunit 2 [Branchiostoma belcheri]KAI8501168.1 DNA polymerase delta subunit 2 [Branchiostoma belcheri]